MVISISLLNMGVSSSVDWPIYCYVHWNFFGLLQDFGAYEISG